MKILASDFDGTLKIDKEVSDKDIAKIKEFQSNGNLFGICTGRSATFLQNFIYDKGIKLDFFVGCNGSYINYKDYEKSYIIEPNIVKSIYTKFNSDVINICFKQKDKSYFIKNNSLFSKLFYNFTEKGKRYKKYKNEYTDKDVLMVTLTIITKRKLLKIRNQLLDEWGEQLNVICGDHWIDISVKQGRKDKGILELQKVMNINHDQIYVIGDSENDYEMLETFHSFGIINDDPNIRRKSEIMVRTVNEAIDILLKE